MYTLLGTRSATCAREAGCCAHSRGRLSQLTKRGSRDESPVSMPALRRTACPLRRTACPHHYLHIEAPSAVSQHGDLQKASAYTLCEQHVGRPGGGALPALTSPMEALLRRSTLAYTAAMACCRIMYPVRTLRGGPGAPE